MSEPNSFDPLAQALRNLPPVPHGLSRERLLFEAGRASARARFDWVWKSLSGLLGCSTIALACLLAVPPENREANKFLARNQENPKQPILPAVTYAMPESQATSADIETAIPEWDKEMLASIRQRREILEGGLDYLPDDRVPTDLAGQFRGRTIFELTDGLSGGGAFAFPQNNEPKK